MGEAAGDECLVVEAGLLDSDTVHQPSLLLIFCQTTSTPLRKEKKSNSFHNFIITCLF